MFSKILIANRGEIACRVMRTAHRLGIATVAVYSDADREAPHVKMADEAIRIGPAPAAQSYLVGDAILEAARRTGAQAIHPGYGFLSENAPFARACEMAGVVFIGPTAQTIEAMGSKSAAKDLMEAAGVPTSPGYQGADQSLEVFQREATRIGYPVLLKAVSGGGGKGMRVVERAEDMAEAMASAQREGHNSFNDPTLLIEKFITHARHLEVQIVGDGRSEVVHFFERDCSVQRRHQKIIEEAPAPNLPAKVRARLLDAGVAAGKAVNYRGAGTVEFLYDGADQVFFMEMNTRLQVEHPVTEEITGHDLVEWQLRVAAGEGLPCPQDAIMQTGHAVESRLYAENPQQNFSPSIGTLTTLRLPEGKARIDSGVAEGAEISPFYDPMIAKIITHGPSRRAAMGSMARALGKVHVAGLETNAAFLHRLCRHPDFLAEDLSTAFIEDHADALFAQPTDYRIGVAAWILQADNRRQRARRDDPWDQLTGWRLNRPNRSVYWVMLNARPTVLNVTRQADEWQVAMTPDATAHLRRQGEPEGEPTSFVFTGTITDDDPSCTRFSLTLDGAVVAGAIAPHQSGTNKTGMRVWAGGETYDLGPADPLAGSADAGAAAGSLTAPMPGTITAHVKAPGDTVEAGETLLVMEAMKMEHAIKAPHAGAVTGFRFAVGQQVSEGDLLVAFEAD
ncbi:MAG: acetyl/propionyl/methylcrotonyl-CoA carboxylase subunit alpha [Pseudomonadota bacterium]